MLAARVKPCVCGGKDVRPTASHPSTPKKFCWRLNCVDDDERDFNVKVFCVASVWVP